MMRSWSSLFASVARTNDSEQDSHLPFPVGLRRSQVEPVLSARNMPPKSHLAPFSTSLQASPAFFICGAIFSPSLTVVEPLKLGRMVRIADLALTLLIIALNMPIR